MHVHAPEISDDSIQCLGNGCFYVRSAADLAKMYLVDLSQDCTSDMSKNNLIDYGKDSCDCPDWPRVWLCKHIAAIAHFRVSETNQPNAPNPVPQVHECSHGDKSLPSSTSVVPILENMISVSRDFLSDGPPSSPGTVRSLRLVELHLTAVIQHSQSAQSPLPDRESLLPNQRTWTQTAERMGEKHRKRPRPTNTSPIAPATKRIGPLNRKQPCVKNTDPYSGGLRSGKDATHDAQTASQNAEACAGPPPPKRRHKRAGTPLLPPASAPPTAPFAFTPSASAPAWYSTQPVYHAGAFPYAPVPVFWPYGHLPPSQPYYPPNLTTHLPNRFMT
jgi:hypothetical protein